MSDVTTTVITYSRLSDARRNALVTHYMGADMVIDPEFRDRVQNDVEVTITDRIILGMADKYEITLNDGATIVGVYPHHVKGRLTLDSFVEGMQYDGDTSLALIAAARNADDVVSVAHVDADTGEAGKNVRLGDDLLVDRRRTAPPAVTAGKEFILADGSIVESLEGVNPMDAVGFRRVADDNPAQWWHLDFERTSGKVKFITPTKNRVEIDVTDILTK